MAGVAISLFFRTYEIASLLSQGPISFPRNDIATQHKRNLNPLPAMVGAGRDEGSIAALDENKFRAANHKF